MAQAKAGSFFLLYACPFSSSAPHLPSLRALARLSERQICAEPSSFSGLLSNYCRQLLEDSRPRPVSAS